LLTHTFIASSDVSTIYIETNTMFKSEQHNADVHVVLLTVLAEASSKPLTALACVVLTCASIEAGVGSTICA